MVCKKTSLDTLNRKTTAAPNECELCLGNQGDSWKQSFNEKIASEKDCGDNWGLRIADWTLGTLPAKANKWFSTVVGPKCPKCLKKKTWCKTNSYYETTASKNLDLLLNKLGPVPQCQA